MRRGTWIILFVAAIFLAQSVGYQGAGNCPNDLCGTNVCDNSGQCQCVSFTNTTGDRYFEGGEYCNTPSHYCNGSLTFWCADNESNSTCAVTFDGNDTCACLRGYGGEHCELVGTACGEGYCYNNATCNGGTCDCLPEWQGNANCSLASSDDKSHGHGIKWWGGLLITGAVLAVVSVLAVIGLTKYRQRMEGINRFKELQKSQMRGRAESDDDEYDSDPYEDEVGKNNRTTASRA